MRMRPMRRRKLMTVVLSVCAVGTALTLVLLALRKNIDLYYTPQEVLREHVPMGQFFRLGGLVKIGSVRENGAQNIRFVITDGQAYINVWYSGMLPSLFREGQGVIAEGRLNAQGILIARQVLAKHDANYKPPDVVIGTHDVR